MTYHPPPPSQLSGCLQTLAISRMIFMILAIPIFLIFSTMISVLIVLVAFNEHPLLGLAAIAVVVAVLSGVIIWEKRRVDRELPPEL